MVRLSYAKHFGCWAFISIYMPRLFVNKEHNIYKLCGYSRSVCGPYIYVCGFCMPFQPRLLWGTGSHLYSIYRVAKHLIYLCTKNLHFFFSLLVCVFFFFAFCHCRLSWITIWFTIVFCITCCFELNIIGSPRDLNAQIKMKRKKSVMRYSIIFIIMHVNEVQNATARCQNRCEE